MHFFLRNAKESIFRLLTFAEDGEHARGHVQQSRPLEAGGVGCDMKVWFRYTFFWEISVVSKAIGGVAMACTFERGICSKRHVEFGPFGLSVQKLYVFDILHGCCMKTFAPMHFTPGIASGSGVRPSS